MPVQTTCKIIVGSGDAEKVAHCVVLNEYDPETLDKTIKEAILAACSALKFKDIKMLRKLEPEISINIFADELGFRPSFHFTPETISVISDAGASLDFDPYVYEPDDV